MCLADSFLAESNKMRFLNTLDLSSGVAPYRGQMTMVTQGSETGVQAVDVVQLVLWRNYFSSVNNEFDTQLEFDITATTSFESMSAAPSVVGLCTAFDNESYIPMKIAILDSVIAFLVSRERSSFEMFKGRCAQFGFGGLK